MGCTFSRQSLSETGDGSLGKAPRNPAADRATPADSKADGQANALATKVQPSQKQQSQQQHQQQQWQHDCSTESDQLAGLAQQQTDAAAAKERLGSAGSKHDSVSSATAFSSWAKKQAADQHQTLDKFIVANISVRGSSEGTTSCECSGVGTSEEGSSHSLSPGQAPYQPLDVVKHGSPKPACHDERNATALAIMRMRHTVDGELEAILGALCAAFSTETAGIALVTGDLICTTTACGAVAPNNLACSMGFCGWMFINPNHELLVIEDTHKDARAADNPFVTDSTIHLGSYIAAPLVTSDGHRIGTLCLLGYEPCTFDATRGQLLANMAELVVRVLERNWAMQLAEQKSGVHLARSLACYDMAYMLVDASKPDWRVIYINKPAERQLGTTWNFGAENLPDLLTEGIVRSLQLDGVPLASYFDLSQSHTEWAPYGCEFAVSGVQGAWGTPLQGQWFELNFRLATSDGLDAEQPFAVGVPAWLPAAEDGFGRNLFFVQLSRTAGSLASSSSMASKAALDVLSSWSDTLSAAQGDTSGVSLVPRGCDVSNCPIDGLVLGPLLGKGSYGRVYRGVYKGMPVAVKIIQNRSRLRTTAEGEPLEAVLTRGMKHLGIMRTITYAYSTCEQPGSADEVTCWMLFEYCDRTCVQDALMKGWFRTDRRITKGTVDLRAVALTAYEIASAMAFLHKHDIVHGDLKGGNVMLSSSSINPHGFTAKVGDFGLARNTEAVPSCASNAYGTVTHMPPEVLLDGNIGKPMDVYSFGVLLWEMLTTARAWAGMRHAQIICQVALLRAQLAVPEGLPPVLQSLLQRCLAPEVEDRCTFEEVLDVLCDFLQRSKNDDLSSVQLTVTQAVHADCLHTSGDEDTSMVEGTS